MSDSSISDFYGTVVQFYSDRMLFDSQFNLKCNLY